MTEEEKVYTEEEYFDAQDEASGSGYNDGYEEGVESVKAELWFALEKHIEGICQDICGDSCTNGALQLYHKDYHLKTCDWREEQGRCSLAKLLLNIQEGGE